MVMKNVYIMFASTKLSTSTHTSKKNKENSEIISNIFQIFIHVYYWFFDLTYKNEFY